MIGQRFGNYQATAVLGEGGMGTVYLAIHPDIGRQVAVKVLRKGIASDVEPLTRFLNEARAANAIRHPNIIEILDSGMTEAGTPYLVMELLTGEALSTRIERVGAMEPTKVVPLVGQAASALGAAHAKGIVHRDLKPDNLFVVADERNPGAERIKLLDFGIAKLQQPVNDMNTPRTRTGVLLGTPMYMSPEQCMQSRDIDHRSDVYSLGLILFEMLTGQPPFVADSFFQLATLHISAAPPLPSRVRPGVSPLFDEIVLKLLAKRPEDRYQSMRELQEALAAIEGGVAKPDLSVSAHTTAMPIARPVTTLSHITGEVAPGLLATDRASAAAGPSRAPVRRGAALFGLALVLAMGGFALWRGSHRPPAPPSTEPIAAPAKGVSEAPATGPAKTAAVPPIDRPEGPPIVIRLKIDSAPPGARIVRASDGVVLGVTPQVLEMASSPRALMVRLEKEGYHPAVRTLSLTADGQAEIELKAVSHPPRPHHSAPVDPDSEPAKL